MNVRATRRCLVLGASGFLGRNLLDLGASWQTLGTAHSHAAPGLISLDLAERVDVEHLLHELRPDLIIYAAGLTAVDLCEVMPDRAEYLNNEVPGSIARRRQSRLLYISTDYVFDGQRGRYAEDAVPSPINAYGVSKARGEQAVLSSDSANIVLRVSGLFDGEGTRDGRFPRRAEMACDRAEINRISSPVHVEDVRRAISILVNRIDSGVFHAGGPEVLSRYAFRQTIAHHNPLLASPEAATYRHRDHKARRPIDSSLVSPRLESLGWRPRPISEWFSPALQPPGSTDISRVIG